MSAGTPNEEAKRRGLDIGIQVTVEAEGRIVNFDADGDPILLLEDDDRHEYTFTSDSMWRIDGNTPEKVEATAPPPPAIGFDLVKAAAFVALYLRIDSRDLSDSQVEQALARADAIAVNYVLASQDEQARSANRSEVVK